jgi:hypothetical protein
MPDFSCNSCESDDMWRPMFINRRKENKTLLKEETETMPYCFMQPYFLLRFATCSFATLSFGAPVAWRRWTSALLDCHYRLPKESSWLHGNIKVHNVTIYVNWPVFNLAFTTLLWYFRAVLLGTETSASPFCWESIPFINLFPATLATLTWLGSVFNGTCIPLMTRTPNPLQTHYDHSSMEFCMSPRVHYR